MEKIITGTGMKRTDSYTTENVGIPSMVLMERAAFGMCCFMEDIIKQGDRVLCVCGMGNNGADGIALARQLVIKSVRADVMTAGNEEKATPQWKQQKKIAENCGVNIFSFEDKFDVTWKCKSSYNEVWEKLLEDYDYVVDAVFGIGLTRNVEGTFADIIQGINHTRSKREGNGKKLTVLSVDISSGLNADTGKIMGNAVKADYTITFGALKSGMILYEGRDVSGEIVLYDIGFPDVSYKNGAGAEEVFMALDDEDIKRAVVRKSHSNKGTYGKVLVVAGSENMYGAAYFSAMAALKAGCGIVRIITHKNNREILYNMMPEAIINVYDDSGADESIIKEAVQWADAIVAGPGIGTSQTAVALLQNIMEHSKENKKPLVIDADGLNIISSNETMKSLYHDYVVITPHMGEAARLMGRPVKEVAENIVLYGKRYSDENKINVVMKDSTTVILGIESLEDKCNNRVCVNTCGNPGMATGGSGDVLAGIIAGVIAGGISVENFAEGYSENVTGCNRLYFASCLAVRIHGRAGDMAAEDVGLSSLTASDILNMIPKVLSK